MTIHPNRRRGEIAVQFDGETRLLCLTLGALAELESAFGVDDLVGLAERFEAGKLSAGDIIRIVGAGLRGAGNRLTDEDVAEMSTEGGAAGFARIATELLWLSLAGRRRMHRLQGFQIGRAGLRTGPKTLPGRRWQGGDDAGPDVFPLGVRAPLRPRPPAAAP